MADWYDFNPVAIDTVDDIFKEKKSWDITIDEFIHVLQVMKEESGGDTIIGTATDVTEELKYFDTKVKGWDGMWKHKKAIQYDTKLVSSEMVMKEEDD